MSTVVLHGSVYLDSVFEENQSFKENRLGGIFNVARALPAKYVVSCSCCVNHSDHNRDFGFNTLTQVSAKPTSSTKIILSDNDYKVQSVSIGACRDFRIMPVTGDWHHVAYLNALQSMLPSDLSRLDGVVSADICSDPIDSDKIKEMCRHIDFLFMNSKEATMLFKDEVYQNIARQATIIHGADFVTVLIDEEPVCFTFQKEEVFDSLGAGDRYAAKFITFRLNGQSILDAAKNAYYENK
jgi:sugar/nucleoside kinase (ribokinase family)